MARVVFLDFDGVLNSHRFAASLPKETRGGVLGLDPQAVARLNDIVTFAKAEVVVSSTFRLSRSCAELQSLLDEHGFVGRVIGKTPALGCAKERGDEIQAWLDSAANYGVLVDNFVILDDDSDMAHLDDRHIKTAFADGLMGEHADLAIRMLQEPPPTIVVPSSAQIARLRFT